jgi:hypothetical protein
MLTNHWSTPNKELQGKEKVHYADFICSSNTFKVKLWLWKIQLKFHSLIHFLHLKFPEPLFPEHISEYSMRIFQLQVELDEQFQDTK